MSKNTPAVEIVDLRKTYKNGEIRALDGINLSINEGEIFGLIGPNGAGKTTLIGCLLALLRPDSGLVNILGKPADNISVRRVTGYVPERCDFEHWMTARQFLKYHHGLSSRDARTAQSEIDDALTRVELDREVWNRRLKTYSRGMLQRLNLAQLLIGKPRIALLDEPTLGLDPTGLSVVRRIVAEMRQDGVTAIVNSHQLDEVERLCDRVAFIKRGQIAAIETIKAETLSEYSMYIRWPMNSLNGTTASVASQAAMVSGARLSECNHEWGRFYVKDSGSASNLLRALIERGIPVDQAVPERTRLEQLFVQNAGVSHE